MTNAIYFILYIKDRLTLSLHLKDFSYSVKDSTDLEPSILIISFLVGNPLENIILYQK